jgi:hypothetical protein
MLESEMETIQLEIPKEVSEKLQPYRDRLSELVLLGILVLIMASI